MNVLPPGAAMNVLLTIAMSVALAPALQGLIKSAKGRLQFRKGPPILQSYADLWKLARKGSVVPESATWVFRFAPWVVFASTLTAAGTVPLVWADGAGYGDAIAFGGLLALGRAALALAAIDAVSNFTSMGASRDLAISAFVEPALLALLFALAIPTGSTDFGAIAATRGDLGFGSLGPASILAFAAIIIVALAETGRLPLDNPDTHLELTMVHEGMLLEYSGRPFALLVLASHVKQFAVLGLVVSLFLPWTLADFGIGIPIALLLLIAKMAVLGLALAVIETLNAKLRILKVPDLLATAAVLGGLSIVARSAFGG